MGSSSNVPDPAATIPITARCHCGLLSATAHVPRSSLPLSLTLCVCNACRKQTGYLAFTWLSTPQSSKPFKITGTPSRIATSTGPDGYDRCFCGVCGTHIYDDSPNTGNQTMVSGAVEGCAGISKLRGVEFAWFSEDGGLACWLPNAKIWEVGGTNGEEPVEPIKGNPYAERSAGRKVGVEKRGSAVEAECFCEGVKFKVVPPTEGLKGKEWDQEALDRWYRGEKYKGVVCACDSCRRTGGFHLAAFMCVPKSCIRDVETGEVFDENSGTLKAYKSSQGTVRHFCKTCGASVFFSFDGRPDEVDIHAGLLKAKSGARSEEWVEWEEEVGFWEDDKDHELIQAVRQGMADRKSKLQ